MAKQKRAGRMSEADFEKMARGETKSGAVFGKGKMRAGVDRAVRVPKDIQRVNVDFSQDMLSALDRLADQVYVSRQAIIKMLLLEALHRHEEIKLMKSRISNDDSKAG